VAGASRTRVLWLAAGLGACAVYAALGLGPALAPNRAGSSERVGDGEPSLAPPIQEPASAARLEALLLRRGSALDLDALLDALQSGSAPPEGEPLPPALVERLADQIERQALVPAMDLLVAETRPLARRALYAAYALLVISERTEHVPPDARQTLVNHFIDGWPALPETERPDVEQALRKLAGDDVADIMNGKGLATDDALQGAREREQALEESSRLHLR
jgi:hypothetical protein